MDNKKNELTDQAIFTLKAWLGTEVIMITKGDMIKCHSRWDHNFYLDAAECRQLAQAFSNLAADLEARGV